MKTVLIISHGGLLRGSFPDELRSRGPEVHVAATGAEGVHMYGQTKADLILLDFDLPEGDGLTTVMEICPEATVFAFSRGDGAVQRLDAAKAAGAKRTYVKPPGFRQLIDDILNELGEQPSTTT